MSIRTTLSALGLLLALAACSGREPVEWNDTAPPPMPPDESLLGGLNISASDMGDVPEAELRPRSLAALQALVPDVARARLDGLRAGRLGAICGRVQIGSGLRPFVVGPDRIGSIARADALDLSSLDDPFIDLYVRWCASEEELLRASSNVLQGPFEDLPPAPVPDDLSETAAPLPEPSTPVEQSSRWRQPPVQQGNGSSGGGAAPERFRDAVRPPRN